MRRSIGISLLIVVSCVMGAIAGCDDSDTSPGGVNAAPTGTTTTSPTGEPTATSTATGNGERPPPAYAVAGDVEGLEGSGLVLRNGGETLTVDANGPFRFPTPAQNGAAFDVKIDAMPTFPSQDCAIASGSPGTINGADANVRVVCGRVPFSVGGTVAGLTTGTVTLQNNGGDPIVLQADGTFTFPKKVLSGSPYSVTIASTSGGATCTVAAGSGVVGSGDVKGVLVNCSADKLPVGGTVSGLVDTLVLKNGSSLITLKNNGTFVFPFPLPAGSSYAVTIAQQPGAQTCTVTGGSGIVGPSSVNAVRVTCNSDTGPLARSVIATVTGLVDWGDGVTLKNGDATITVRADGTYPFPTQRNGEDWHVTVTSPTAPPQTCSATPSSGTIAGEDAEVTIACSAPSIGAWAAAGDGWTPAVPCYDGIVFVTTAPNAVVCTDTNGVRQAVSGGTWTDVSGAFPGNGLQNRRLTSIMAQYPSNSQQFIGTLGVPGTRNLARGSSGTWTQQAAEVDILDPNDSTKFLQFPDHPGVKVPFSIYGVRFANGANQLAASWDPRDGGRTVVISLNGGGSGTPGPSVGSPYFMNLVGDSATGVGRTIVNMPGTYPKRLRDLGETLGIKAQDLGNPGPQDYLAVWGKKPNAAFDYDAKKAQAVLDDVEPDDPARGADAPDEATGGVYYSPNSGKSWFDVTTNIPAPDRHRIWTVRGDQLTTGSAAVLYAGLRPGASGARVYKSSDSGDSWTDVSFNLPQKAEVLSIYARGADVYLGTTIGLFRLNASGDAWIYSGFADRKVRAVMIDFVSTSPAPKKMYVGVEDEVGLYEPTP